MKTKIRKPLAVLLAAVFTLMIGANAFPVLLPRAFAFERETGDCGVHVTYQWNKTTGEVTISGSGPMWDYDNNPSPFLFSDNVTTVVIDYGVTSVGEFTFAQCVYLESVTFPDDGSFKTIGNHAFANCFSLTGVTLPRGLTAIGDDAFYGAGLESVTLPKSVTAIPECAFADCVMLKTLNYTGGPADWAAITVADDAFEDAPVSAPTRYYYGVEGAENAINDVGVNDGSDAYLARLATAYVAFHKLSAADKAKVTNADALQAAIDAALGYEFGQCGNCVGCAWNKTTGKVVIGGVGPMWDYDSNTFDDNPSPFLFSNNVKTVVIGCGVTSVGEFTFFECDSLESVTFPDDGSFKTIGNYTFTDCFSLTGVTFPRGLTAIGDYAFCGDGLESVTIPGTVTKIGQHAFYSCDLTSVTIPKSVTEIPNGAFAYCSYLECINYTGSPADWAAVTVADDAFEGAPVSAPTCYYYGVEGAINAINDIGTVEYTDECKARIDAARTAFGRLTDAEKALVTNAGVLTAAETDFAALKAAADQAAADWRQIIVTDDTSTLANGAYYILYEDLYNILLSWYRDRGITTIEREDPNNPGAYCFVPVEQIAAEDLDVLKDFYSVNVNADADSLYRYKRTCPIPTGNGEVFFYYTAYMPLDMDDDGYVTVAWLDANVQLWHPEHVYGDTGDARFTCTVCGEVDNDLKAAIEELAAAKATLAGAIETAREYYGSIKDDYPVIAEDLDTKLQQAEGVLANAAAAIDEVQTMTGLAGTALDAAKETVAAQALIDAIGTVEYTAESKEKIDAAKAAYDALTDAQKALVDADAVTTLENAVAAYALLENKAAFEAYKTTLNGLADGMKQDGDSDACLALIDAAKAAVNALEYDENIDLAANKEALENAAALAQLHAALAAQRKADQSIVKPEKPVINHTPCPICGELHDGDIFDNFRGLIHAFIDLFTRLTMNQVSYVIPNET